MHADPEPVPLSTLPSYAWWQTGVIYQVYPRSFQDTDSDGIGDINGIARRLPHLIDLGVDAIWISPIFASPMRDFGYDVSNHCEISPLFGTLAHFDALLASAHAAGLKIILDFVPNHTSDQHPWFRDSRSSRLSHKRDWYIWRDRKLDGSAPNNWESEFGGSAWTFDHLTNQYYYHAYLKEQPDLNWRNPEVERAMCDVLRFWFDRGVDGFRVDAIHHLLEDEKFRDNPPDSNWHTGMPPSERWLQIRTVDQPDVHASIKAMRRVADAYPEKVMIGEAYLPIDRLMSYYGADLTGFHLPFNFHLISTPWQPEAIASLIHTYENALPRGGWPNWVLGNHDRPRVGSRVGAAQARVAAMLLLTLRGTPTIYQGEEIGMEDVPIPQDQVQDPFELNVPGFGLGRDPVRTPMPWTAEQHGGFTDGRPWLPLNSDRQQLNVAVQRADQRSLLSLYKALIQLRRNNEVLSVGTFRLVAAEEGVLAYARELGERQLLIALNMTDRGQVLRGEPVARKALLSTYLDDPPASSAAEIHLRPNEGLVLRLVAETISEPG
ncbi:MAG: alpha-amylase family glycosyl hydrolase [Pseudomonadota bacterium]|nr:alpha-amylase family glycosyl hydrolase [Pseudomonadota bacterium]